MNRKNNTAATGSAGPSAIDRAGAAGSAGATAGTGAATTANPAPNTTANPQGANGSTNTPGSASPLKDRTAKSGKATTGTTQAVNNPNLSASGGKRISSAGLNGGNGGTQTVQTVLLGGVASPMNMLELLDSHDASATTPAWIEWNDADVASEKWTTKHAFEEAEPFTDLPRSLKDSVAGFKRANELTGEGGSVAANFVIVAPSTLTEDYFATGAQAQALFTSVYGTGQQSVTSTTRGATAAGNRKVAKVDEGDEESVSPANIMNAVLQDIQLIQRQKSNQQVNETDDGSSEVFYDGVMEVFQDSDSVSLSAGAAGSQVIHSGGSPVEAASSASSNTAEHGYMVSKFIHSNRHLRHSEFMRGIILKYHMILDHYRQARNNPQHEDVHGPWDAIFPKGKDGLPSYNPSGKYAVKLYHLGAWRKVIIDDRVPVDAEGRALLISSWNSGELWPLLLSKALCKISSLSVRDCELVPDVSLYHVVTGHVPELVTAPSMATERFWQLISCCNNNRGSNGSAGTAAILPVANGASATSAPVPASAGATQSATNKSQTNATANTATSNAPKAAAATNAPSNVPPNSVQPSTVPQLSANKLPSAVIAYADISEYDMLFDGDLIPLPSRIIDTKETFPTTLPDGEIETRYIKLREFGFGRAVRRKSCWQYLPLDIQQQLENNGHANVTDIWLTFKDFMKIYSLIYVYHHPKSFSFERVISRFGDSIATDFNSTLMPVIYVDDPTRDVSLWISVSSSLSKFRKQSPTCFLEQVNWSSRTETTEKKVTDDVSSIVTLPNNATTEIPTVGIQRKARLRIRTEFDAASCFTIPAGSRDGFRIVVEPQFAFCVNLWSREPFRVEEEAVFFKERLGLFVHDSEGSYQAQQPSSWFLLFKHVFNPTKPIHLMPQLQMLDPLAKFFTQLHVIDNETQTECPQLFFKAQPLIFKPNTRGYTILADCRSLVPLVASKFRLRLVTADAALAPTEAPTSLSLNLQMQDLEDIYLPNKYFMLFRQLLKIKDDCPLSVQLSFSVPVVGLTLQLFDDEQLLWQGKGKGLVTIPLIHLKKNENEPTIKEGKEGKESKEKDKERQQQAQQQQDVKEERVKSATIRHKYILQAVAEENDIQKYVIQPFAFLYSGDMSAIAMRSRKGAAPDKKKKAAGPAAGPGQAAPAGAGGANAQANAAATSATDGDSNNNGMEPPSWRLRFYSPDSASLTVTKDTEKEDRYKSIKSSWETERPGRATKAKESRDAYLRAEQAAKASLAPTPAPGDQPNAPNNDSVSPSPVPPASSHGRIFGSISGLAQSNVLPSSLEPSPLTTGFVGTNKKHAAWFNIAWPYLAAQNNDNILSKSQALLNSALNIGPRVLSAEQNSLRHESRLERMTKFDQFIDSVRHLRLDDRDWRHKFKSVQIEQIDEKCKEGQQFRQMDVARREAYRQKIAKQVEAAAEAAAVAAKALSDANKADGAQADAAKAEAERVQSAGSREKQAAAAAGKKKGKR